ncbi:MAG TPA: hypothetical protein VL176_12970, partial [Steroidobacteraceae bacterium]|nr:hypothetical protein [Steroidobacteraceae bacterium]
NITMAVTPNSGVKGPVYFDGPSLLPDPTLSTTNADSGCAIFEVAPGDYEATAVHPTLKCAPFSAYWPGSDSAHAKVRAVAGYFTLVEFSCK